MAWSWQDDSAGKSARHALIVLSLTPALDLTAEKGKPTEVIL